MRKFPRKFLLTHSFFSQLHSGDLGALAGLVNLTSVNLEWCYQITGDLGALSGLLQLEKVDLFNCDKITGDEKAIKQALPKCRFLF